MRQLTIIESPFTATPQRSIDQNLTYLCECLRDSWNRGELPFASHAFFPLFLHESLQEERQAGIEAGYQFWQYLPADAFGDLLPDTNFPKICFYIDHGISPGMTAALARARDWIGEVGIEMRTLRPLRPPSAGEKDPTTD